MRKTFLFLIFLGSFFIVQNMGHEARGEAVAQDQGKIAIGRLEDFPAGTIKALPSYKIIIFSDKDGLYAVSTQCTHMGCTLDFKKATGLLMCPCHGSSFNKEGAVEHGPARKNLSWFSIESGKDGMLYVDKTKIVPEGTKFKTTPKN